MEDHLIPKIPAKKTSKTVSKAKPKATSKPTKATAKTPVKTAAKTVRKPSAKASKTPTRASVRTSVKTPTKKPAKKPAKAVETAVDIDLQPAAKMAVRKARSSTKAAPASKLASLQEVIVSTLDDRKAEHIVTISLKGKADFADAMIVASGTSQRHVSALATHLLSALKDAGHRAVSEGLDTCDWVLVDAGDIIVHLFRPETREYYRIEKMWGVPAAAQASQ